ncbi:hypothetical protein [Streptomyces sp. CS081A]|uniref:hypothetical protein n=1 Tax=Streptomyces sp. CS081A TaxID=2162709 RepID=UPI000D50803F|nr:hypothetical protein [Streptomyces sp. CS081A]PVC77273.1 hypothetical protein DBP18_02425 [Streptomyces sp. CS081A]
MRVRHRHRALLAVTTAALVLSLTACNGDDQAAATPTTGPDTTASGPAATGPAATGAPADGSPSEAPKAPEASQAPKASQKPNGGGSANNTEAYAYKHPCAMTQLSLNVRQEGTRRIIEVANKGASACGLDLLPAVALGDSSSADRSNSLRPLVPSGIGGPNHALLAGTKAYAVLDLNPGGRAGAKGIDEMNVLVSPSHMPNADTRSFPLGAGASVSGPELGLYHGSVADAVASMRQADIAQQ